MTFPEALSLFLEIVGTAAVAYPVLINILNPRKSDASPVSGDQAEVDEKTGGKP